MLLGLTSPTGGTVEVYGASPHRAVTEGRVSAVMQTGGLLPDFTVRETIRAIAALHGRPDRVEVVIERTGLGPLADRLVKACSGGEQQRLKFALALVPDPDLVILDEPTTGMDVARPAGSSGTPCAPTPPMAARSSSPPTTSPRPTSSPTARC